jgi:Uma2 family endonuclease
MSVLTQTLSLPDVKETEQRLTLDDFFALPEGPPYFELEAGALVTMPRPHERHQMILAALIAVLWPHITSRKLGRIWPEIEVILPDQSDVYVPDLVFLARDKLAYLGEDGRIHGAPDLVVEILSPGTRKRDRTHKMQVYRQAGVRWYWLADQDDLTIEEFILNTRGYQIRQVAPPGEVFKPALFPEIQLNLIDVLNESMSIDVE